MSPERREAYRRWAPENAPSEWSPKSWVGSTIIIVIVVIMLTATVVWIYLPVLDARGFWLTSWTTFIALELSAFVAPLWWNQRSHTPLGTTGVHPPKRQLFVDTFPLPRIRRNAKTPASSRESTGNSHNTSPKRPPRTQRKVQAPSHPTKQTTPKPGHGPHPRQKTNPLTKNRAPKGQRSENADSTTEPETNSRNAKKPTAAVRQKTARNE